MHELLEWRGRASHTVLDLDWRPMFWESPEAATEQISPILDHVTVAIGNRDECEIAVGTRDPDEAADRLLEHGVSQDPLIYGAAMGFVPGGFEH